MERATRPAIGPRFPAATDNTASGFYSFAAGRRAKTQTADPTPVVHDGTFVWADSSDFDFNSTAANQFAARATGGVYGS